MRKKLTHFAGYFVSLLSIIYFVSYLKKNFSEIPGIPVTLASIFLLSLLVALYVAGIVLASFAWNLLLRMHRCALSRLAVVGIYCKSQFGKYLPGNVGHHFGRVLFAKQNGISLSVCLQTMLLETVTFLIIGAALSGIVFYSALYPGEKNPGFIGSVTIPVVIMLVFAVPALLFWGLGRFPIPFIEKLTGEKKLVLPSFALNMKVCLMLSSSFVISGLILDIIGYYFGSDSTHLFFLIGVFSASWISGFVIPGAPAGLGVREVVLISLLESVYGSGVALTMSLVFRIVTTAGDAVALVVGFIASYVSNARQVR